VECVTLKSEATYFPIFIGNDKFVDGLDYAVGVIMIVVKHYIVI